MSLGHRALQQAARLLQSAFRAPDLARGSDDVRLRVRATKFICSVCRRDDFPSGFALRMHAQQCASALGVRQRPFVGEAGSEGAAS